MLPNYISKAVPNPRSNRAGLLFLPAMIARNCGGESVLTEHIPMSLPWLTLAAIFAGLFTAVLGPGIHFSK